MTSFSGAPTVTAIGVGGTIAVCASDFSKLDEPIARRVANAHVLGSFVAPARNAPMPLVRFRSITVLEETSMKQPSHGDRHSLTERELRKASAADNAAGMRSVKPIAFALAVLAAGIMLHVPAT